VLIQNLFFPLYRTVHVSSPTLDSTTLIYIDDSILVSSFSFFFISRCKDLVQIIDSFDILLEAIDYAERFPSTAEDSSTDQRFVQYVMTRVSSLKIKFLCFYFYIVHNLFTL